MIDSRYHVMYCLIRFRLLKIIQNNPTENSLSGSFFGGVVNVTKVPSNDSFNLLIICFQLRVKLIELK